MRFLVACELPAEMLAQLEPLSAESVYRPNLTAPELREAIANVGILIVNDLRVSGELIARAPALQMIVRAGSGPGDIALDEASHQGVFVCHAPDKDAQALAELAFGLIVALDRSVVEATLALREGRWMRAEFPVARGLAGRTLGILGGGPAALRLAARAKAFEMNVLGWPAPGSKSAAAEEMEYVNWPREIARRADVVVVCAQPDEEQTLLVDAEFLESMAPGSYLVHMGHAGAVDEAALENAIRTRHLRVGLDVYSCEPATDAARFRSRLLELPNVIGTQHMGPLTTQASAATAAEVVRVIREFVVSGDVLNPLNICDRSPATWQLVMRIRDEVGVIASIMDAVRADGINAQEVSSRVFSGAKAAWCSIALDERPSTEALEAIRALPNVLHLELRAVV